MLSALEAGRGGEPSAKLAVSHRLLGHRQMGFFCPLTKKGKNYYCGPDNAAVYLAFLGLSSFPVTHGSGLFSKTSSMLVVLSTFFPHQLTIRKMVKMQDDVQRRARKLSTSYEEQLKELG